MCNPPRPGDPSHPQYAGEVAAILESLRVRGAMLCAEFNALPGVHCNATDGALYSFPSIALPQAAIDKARAQGHTPDEYYCLALLDATGISTVPGSGFLQRPGTFHVRTTILPQMEEMHDMLRLWGDFHRSFMLEHHYKPRL